MLSRLSLVALCLFNFTIGFSQKKNFDTVEKDYTNYFRPNHETIFTHLNKSIFFGNEQLWFKSYVYDIKTQLPYFTTTNVYAEIYNESGQLMNKKLYYAENGMTHGNFDLGKKFQPGIYFLKVTTNYMKNFDGEHYSLQQFEILGGKEVEPLESLSETLYDFQLLPEGGKFLNDAMNTVGFKILNNEGKGVKIGSGKVTDSENSLISTFASNEFGMGKFNVFLDYKKLLTVSVTLEDGSELHKQISNIDLKGITISVNTLNPERLFVNLKTNISTLSEIVNKPFYLVIHRDGLLKKIDVSFEANKLEYIIPIPKSELFDGINILTLFNNEKKPLVERMIFNPSDKLVGDIEFLGQRNQNDSTEIRLRSSIKDTIKRNISISVLPASTKSYEFDNTIVSSFLLKPYIKSPIENSFYYFKNQDRKTTYDLDLLLLTQGWSSYSWNSIFSPPIPEIYHFENGMQLKGKLSSKKNHEDDEVVLYSGQSGLRLTTYLEEDNTFNFDGLFLIDGSSVAISLIDIEGKLSKPNLYYNLYPILKTDSIKPDVFKTKKTNGLKVNFKDFVFYNTTVLDTVNLKAEVKKNEPIRFMQGGFRSEKIDLVEGYAPVGRIIDVIRDNGFDVQFVSDPITFVLELHILARRGNTSFVDGIGRPNVFLDNVPISGTDLNQLTELSIAEVEALHIARTASATGSSNTAGNINIFTKRGFDPKKLDTYNSSIIDFGFTVPETYTSPYYDKFNQKLFDDYAVLNWIPDLEANENGEFVFKIPKYMYDSINLYIEGLCSDGSLISKTETINLN